MGIRVNAATIQLRVTDIAQGVAFYQHLLGRPADLDADPQFKEWQVFPDFWVQVCEGTTPMQSRMRFGVNDVEARRTWVADTLRVQVSAVERIDGLVAWCDFDDPWGNKIGLFQDLAC